MLDVAAEASRLGRLHPARDGHIMGGEGTGEHNRPDLAVALREPPESLNHLAEAYW